jgi:D-alanine transaminase
MKQMQNLAWIDGTVIDLSSARVPLEDRAYLLGDGIYEVIRIYDQTLFYLDAHLERLQNSAAAIRLDLPYSSNEITAAAAELIKKSGIVNGYLYMQVTRGCAKRDHIFPVAAAPSMTMYVRDLPPLPALEQVKPGQVITLPDERWLNCHIKTVNLLPNLLARQKSFEAGAMEAVLYRTGGVITEGTRSNFFALIDGVVRTHPATNLILPGISRQIALEILAEQQIKVSEEAVTLEELQKVTEAWLTSTTMEVNPVGTIDSMVLPEPLPGPVCLMLMKKFRSRIAAGSNRNKI